MENRELTIAGIGTFFVGAIMLGSMAVGIDSTATVGLGLGVVLGIAIAMAIDVALGRR